MSLEDFSRTAVLEFNKEKKNQLSKTSLVNVRSCQLLRCKVEGLLLLTAFALLFKKITQRGASYVKSSRHKRSDNARTRLARFCHPLCMIATFIIFSPLHV